MLAEFSLTCIYILRLGKHMFRNKKNKNNHYTKNYLKSYMIGNSLMKKKLKIKDKK